MIAKDLSAYGLRELSVIRRGRRGNLFTALVLLLQPSTSREDLVRRGEVLCATMIVIAQLIVVSITPARTTPPSFYSGIKRTILLLVLTHSDIAALVLRAVVL